MTYKEIIYMILDELKLSSKDSYFTEDHIKFLALKYRNLLISQRYKDIKKDIPIDCYQSITLTLSQVPAISGLPCEGGTYLKSTVKIPSIFVGCTPRLFPMDYFQGELTYVSRDRMRYVGEDKYLGSFIYCTLGPDSYLYFKSSNPQFLYMAQVKMSTVFFDAEACFNLGSDAGVTDIMDSRFPVDDSLVASIIGLVCKELLGPIYAPKDEDNNSSDDLDNSIPNQNYINAMKQQKAGNQNTQEND